MSRALIVVHTDTDRQRAANWCRKAPKGCRIEFKEPKRSVAQNDRFWAALTDVASQATHSGRKYDAEEWKFLFMHAIGRDMRLTIGLDGKTLVPLGNRSSDLSKAEMSELIEFIVAWGTERGVTFHDRPTPPIEQKD